jgi:TRAP-type C4-dicarboxylate transport system permease large subunit
MLLCFAALVVAARWPIGMALVASAWAGAAFNGHLLPLRHLVEGAFAYLDPIMVIATATVFVRFLGDGGALSSIGAGLEAAFGKRPALLLPLVTLLVMFPGMITGSSSAAVLSTGGMGAAILIGVGLSRPRAAALVAMAGVLGQVAPPVNIPAMIIGAGLDLPYVGFAAPLAMAAFPVALASAYWLGWPLLRGARSAGGGSLASSLPLWRALLPIAAATLLMTAPAVARGAVPDPGLPLVFLAAAAVTALVLPRFGLLRSATAAVQAILPVLGILVGVGGFIQVMTLVGGRGWMVAAIMGVPAWAAFGAAAISLPLFGAVSAYGSASVVGVPFLLAFIGRNEIVTTSALSLLASLGDLMLPVALAATLAAGVAGVENRYEVLRRCAVPTVAALLWATAMLVLAPLLGRVLT